jgi:sugar phosphate permease
MPASDTPSRPRAPLDWRLLGFGFLIAFFSSFGQTFFIALFGGELRAAHGLSHGQFGTLYSAATMMSGLAMIWVGAMIDRVDLRLYSVLAVLGLALAAAMMALAEALVVLGVALFLLRLSGQGVMNHAALTSMARYFEAGRGRAVGFAALGHAAGEGLLPIVTVLMIAAIGWREVWGVSAGFLALVALPVLMLLLLGHGAREAALGERLKARALHAGEAMVQVFTRRMVLRDVRFYLLLPTIIAPGYIVTGIFFHQVHIVETKGWDFAMYAGSFIFFAIAGVAGTMGGGWLVDRLTALRMMPVYLMPMALACLLLGLMQAPVAAPVFMALTGLTAGMAAATVTSMWAELYGIENIGAIRALGAVVMVISTALSPGMMGVALDWGVGIETILYLCAGYCVGAALLALLAVRRAAARR